MADSSAAPMPPAPSAPPALPIRHIAWSARILAATRAEETQRTTSPPLVIDPLAHSLAYPNDSTTHSTNTSDPSASYAGRRMWLHHTHFHFRRVRDKSDAAEVERLRREAEAINSEAAERPDTLIRCRYIDQMIAAEASGVKQLVLLGAGLDTRAYRCEALAGVRVYEVDRAEVLAYKQSVLQRLETKAELKVQSVEYIVGELTDAGSTGSEAEAETAVGKGSGGTEGGGSSTTTTTKATKKKRQKAESELDLTKARDRRALQAIQHKRSKQQQLHTATAAVTHPDASSQQPHTSNQTQPQPDSTPSSASPTSALAPTPVPAWSTALLASATFDPALPTCWVLEGVCMYLTPAQLSALLRTAASLCLSPSVLCFDHVTGRLGRWHRLFSSAFSRDECVRLTEANGWRVGERRRRGRRVDKADEEKEEEGRRVVVGYDAGDGVVGIGRDELSYGRYLRDALLVQDGNGRQVEVHSYIVTARRHTG